MRTRFGVLRILHGLDMRPPGLRAIKTLHTVVWAFFAACIVAIPVTAWRGALGQGLALTGIVMVEVIVLAANRMRCPLTDVAARHTNDRRDNFDIYLPEWLARHNKVIFGWLFVAGALMLLGRWALALMSKPRGA
jgi:hypothetical protein